MNQQLLEREAANEAPDRDQERPRPLRTAAPAVFRRQERFWKEVRKRIAENNPANGGAERLY
jgi:hypothetical protein